MNKKAVLCGINQYKSQTDLRGCVNDVKNIHQVLTETFEFEPTQIQQLVDEQVTKTAIWQKWQWLVQDAKPGDQLFFHFSGHGSYVTDDQTDEEDGYDEITCLYDMDFDDPESFIRDDEWNYLIQKIPSSVQFTMVMDNCHSGTGTRNLLVRLNGEQRSLAVDGNSSSRSLKEIAQSSNNYQDIITDEKIVLPRFLVPPVKMQVQQRTVSRRSTLTAPSRSENILVVAACRADQTAADAYLDRDFHGAFTYYLCQQLQRSPHQSSQELIYAVKESLFANQFAQEPQHDGTNRATGFLSSTERSNPFDDPFILDQISANASLDPSLNSPMESLMPSHQPLTPENQRLLIEAYMKLLDTIAGSPATDVVSASLKAEGDRSFGDRYLVYVHGISRHTAGYSDDWWNSLRPYVGQTFRDGTLNTNRREVLWSDLVNARSLSSDAVDPMEKERLRLQIEAVLNERQQQTIMATNQGREIDRSAVQTRSLSQARGLSFDDFLTYMLNSSVRQQIIDRFTKVVEPLLRTDSRIDIISHSWGTVVAYEGLRELEKNLSVQGRVSNFFTVGSALSILPVRTSLRAENQDGRRPAMVDRWINLDAKGDIVGGMIRDRFAVNHEFLELTPGSCQRGWFGYDISCAHSSYFSADNTAVNRDLFARFILR
ncbi:MAG: hypothetical protein Kow00121_45940 [Elainellaceae cyanobacterium]